VRDAIPERFRARLADAASGNLPPNVALMHILMEATDAEEARAVLSAACVGLRDGLGATRLRDLQRLYESNPDAFTTVKAVLARVAHDEAPANGVSTLAAAFDRAASAAPEGSVALYTLGSPALLNAATAEVVDTLRRWGVIAPNRALLEIGCGIGRFEEALAPQVSLAVGIDVSGAMLAQARRRCSALANTGFLLTSGSDLAAFRDASFDLVLAVDTFPYLIQAGPELAAQHIREAARVLRPGGDLVVLNYSYRGDLARDQADLAGAAAGLFRTLRNGERPFRLWDGAAFHLARLG
jgi:SAM-dependent methyltransferase